MSKKLSQNGTNPFLTTEGNIQIEDYLETQVIIKEEVIIKDELEEELYSCNLCDQNFSVQDELVRHKEIHTNKKTFDCKICHEKFSLKENFTAHKQLHKRISCNICNKIFYDQSTLLKHKRLHTGEKPFSCDICEKTFNQLLNLTQHKRRHSGKNLFSCDNCEKSFIQKSSLIEHKHICQKVFEKPSNLTQHKQFHTEENPLSCDVCQKMFTQQCILDEHRKTHEHHTKENSFKCDICYKTFIRVKSFVAHKNSHNIREKSDEKLDVMQSVSTEDVTDPLIIENTQMKELFYKCLSRKPQKKNSFQMSREKYENLIKEVKIAKSTNEKQNRHYWLVKHYDVLTVGDKEHLVFPITNNKILYYVPVEQIFDILYSTHESIGHGGRDRMRRELQQRYKNITLYEIQMFLNLCEPCIQKKKSEKKCSVGKPVQMQFCHFDSRCEIDFIDYQMQPDNEYKFAMVYQDHLTKFVVLKPLKTKNADEVAQQMLDIFLLFGAPSILQSNDDREFYNNIIENLKVAWPELKIIHGKQRQDIIERPNSQIESMLNTWMLENKTKNWTKALGFVQFMKNRSLHVGINKSPYEAMFGQTARVGLASSNLSTEIIPLINTEEELEMVMKIDEIEIENENGVENGELNEGNTEDFLVYNYNAANSPCDYKEKNLDLSDE